MKYGLLIFLFAALSFSPWGYSQESLNMVQKDNIDQIADSLFVTGNYFEALPHFEKLVIDYPRDPLIRMKTGACLIYASRETGKAIEHLKLASTQEVPNIVYYYLAEAHLLNYQFEDAINYYRRFMINGGSPNISKQTVEQQVNKCENGAFMLKYIYQPKIVARERVPIVEFYQYINTKSDKGAFVPKPVDLMTSVDKSMGDSSLIFYPHNPMLGDRIFYSSYGNNTSNGREIFMIEKLKDGFWSKPLNLGGVINTPFDEDFPYLATDGLTLYFASKGHYSMGGYDIYKSVYNSSTKQWSTPENLGFPFSSTYDDFLYVPNNDESQASFVTNRNVEKADIDVVLLTLEESPIRKSISSLETIHAIAKLEATMTEKPAEVQKAETSKESEKQKSASFSSVENDTEYVRVLAKGFEEQMKADSARIQLEALRQKFDYITTAEERRKLEAQVVRIENILLEAQKNADSYFAQASQIEQEYLSGKRKPADKPTSTFATDKPEFLYQAQFASTVFHTDELNRLAQTEKLAPQIETLQRQILAIKVKSTAIDPDDSTGEYSKVYSEYLAKLKTFNSVASGYFSTKKGLYRECISVAMVKRGAADQPEIRAEIDRANKHFQSAIAIRNNATEEAQIESEYDALQLDELGILRLELAFSKLWGMKLFEQEVLSKLYRLEQNIFGRKLTDTSPKATSATTMPEEKPVTDESAEPAITKTEESVDTKPIVFEPDPEPYFQILDETLYNSNNPIPSHLPLPQGIIYKIQLAAFSNPVPISHFKGMYPLSQEQVSGGKVTKYYTGLFPTLSEAQKSLPVVKSKGFKDAFIAAWHNGRNVPLARAEILEKTEPANINTPSVDIQIEKETHLYLVQIGTYKGRLPDDISQTVRALAPGKDIVRKPDNQGSFIYSISSFSTSAEANRVKDNLVASGLINAIVIAVELEN